MARRPTVTVVVMPARRVAACALAAGAAVALLAGCTNTESPINRTPHTGTATASPGAGGIQTVTLTAGNDYRFHPSTIVVHPGRVRIMLVNDGTGAPHNWSLTGFPAAYAPNAQAGQTTMVSFIAPSPGKYQFVCTIHERQGQTGTMVVEP
jgi:plastocyanin